MKGDRRESALGYNATLVLSALAGGCRYGLEIIERTGLSSGTVYPALRRMEADGFVQASWEEDEAAHRSGRPARRYYALTPAGDEARSEALARVRAQQQILGLAPDQGR